MKIIQERKYMINYDDKYNSLCNASNVFIIGEIKTKPQNINTKDEQKENYLKFCKMMNEKNNGNYFYYFIFLMALIRVFGRDHFF